jgi:hypothetical protein
MRRLALASALLLGVTLGCRSKQTSNADATTTDTSITTAAPAPEPAASTDPRDFSFDERQQFTESIRQRLATADQQIAELADQVKSKGGAVSDRAVANIRASRRAADRDLRRAEAATAANWDQVQTAVNSSLDRLSESIEAAQPK